jgi:CDP-diacylglycerol--glycerol-3-phosphate 3-phosphatidyltransferase
MKLLPNTLSISRIVLALTLFLFEPFTVLFIAIYVVAVLTDAMDGFFARLFKVQTKLGSNLDTLADFMLVGITLIRIIPVMDFDTLPIVIITSIFTLKVVALIISYAKYKQVVSLNTYLSKFLAVMAFLFPFLYWLIKFVFPQIYEQGITENTLVIVMGGIGILIMLEEVLIHLASPTPNPHAKGFMFDKKADKLHADDNNDLIIP